MQRFKYDLRDPSKGGIDVLRACIITVERALKKGFKANARFLDDLDVEMGYDTGLCCFYADIYDDSETGGRDVFFRKDLNGVLNRVEVYCAKEV